MTLILYGVRIGPSCRKVQWALEEAGVDYEFVEVDLHGGETRTPEFRGRNPNGTIPTLVHDGVAIWESNAIVGYVADVFGGVPLPAAALDRAHTQQWMFFEATSLEPKLHRAWLAKYRARRGEPFDAAAYARAVEDARVPLVIVDEHLRRRDWMVADRFTIADLVLGATIAQHSAAEVSLDPWPHVAAWMTRLSARATPRPSLAPRR